MTVLLRYIDNDRHYHNFTHIGDMMRNLQEVFPSDYNNRVLKAAILYHDCIYKADAATGFSEMASADYAEEELIRNGWATKDTNQVKRLIALTYKHEPHSADRVGQVLCDLDLAGLGTEQYHNNSILIRKEYAMFEQPEWVAGRKAFITSFLAKDHIFNTGPGVELWEDKARANLQAELDALSA